jgi:hypothetical protein
MFEADVHLRGPLPTALCTAYLFPRFSLCQFLLYLHLIPFSLDLYIAIAIAQLEAKEIKKVDTPGIEPGTARKNGQRVAKRA